MADHPQGEPAPDAAPKRGRTPGFHMTEEHRSKIRNSQILNRLIGHVEGSVEMIPSQVTAGLGLINKYLPNLQTTTHQGDEEGGPQKHEHVHRIEEVIVDPQDGDGSGI